MKQFLVLLQQASAAAASFYDHAELTELHHNRKADAPSGTCIKTAELIEELGKSFNKEEVQEHESISGCRGGLRESGLRLHSIRLPGLIAHQEVKSVGSASAKKPASAEKPATAEKPVKQKMKLKMQLVALEKWMIALC